MVVTSEIGADQFIGKSSGLTSMDGSLSINGREGMSLLFSSNNLISDSQLILFLLVSILIVMIGIPVNFMLYQRNLEYIRQLETQNVTINDEKDHLERINEFRQKFITILAHDIINPFNALIGFSTLLKDDFNTISEHDKKEYIEVICKSASSNYKTVRRLFEWAKNQGSGNIVNKKDMNLKSTVDTILESHMIMAQDKNINMTNNISEFVTIHADENILSTVICNFINNAIKFTADNGSIYVGHTRNKDEAKIVVKDTGVGMTDIHLANLFDPEKHVYARGTNKEKGFGLGLVLSKELAELHNSKISIESEVNVGTIATLHLYDPVMS
jgi:signal transduction histidine kinase